MNTLAEQPLVQGVTRPFNNNESAGESVVSTLKGIPSSFIPTLLNQIKQLTDNSSGNTKDANPLQEAKNLVMNKVPGLSDNLQPKIETLGQEKEMYQDRFNNIFNVLFNPAFVSRADVSPEAKLVLDIYKNSGESQQAPRVVPVSQKITLNGETKSIKLRPIEQTKMQQYVGTVVQKMFAKLASNEKFVAQPDEDKAKYLAELLADINTAAKIKILGHRPKNPANQVRKIIKQFPE